MRFLFPLLLVIPLAASPSEQVGPPARERAAAAAPQEKPDEELAEVRGHLESAGMRIVELFREPENGRMLVGKARLLGSPDPLIRAEDVALFAERRSDSGGFLVRLCLPVWERPDIAGGDHRRRELMERVSERAYFVHVRPWRSEGEEEDEEDGDGDGRRHLLAGFHYLSAADLRSFAAFVDDFAKELSSILDVEAADGPFLLGSGDRERLPVEAARRHLAERVRARSLRGLSAAPPAPGSSLAEDPLSLASHALDAPLVDAFLGSGLARDLLPELEGDPFAAVTGRRALRLALKALAEDRSQEDVDALRALAYDPATGEPGNAWALYHWARYLMGTLPEEDQAPRVVAALDALRHSSRLGCEVALGYYLHLLSIPSEPLVNGESHWEGRARWKALWRNFSPHFLPESIEVEDAYRSGDRSPVRVGVEEGEDLALVREAVAEMNAARVARGWKTIEVWEERPASEPLVADPEKRKDPAEAGS